MKRTLYLGDTVDGAVFAFIELATKDPGGRPIGPVDDPMPPVHGHVRLPISCQESGTDERLDRHRVG